jgi:hypothetical protein
MFSQVTFNELSRCETIRNTLVLAGGLTHLFDTSDL